MKYYIILSALIAMLFTGCGVEPKPCVPKTVTKVIYKTKIVKVPVPCDMKKPTCDFKGDGYEPSIRMMECIVTQKKVIDACLKPKKTVTE